jgi:S-adenosylmethionine uptake transporter
MLTPDPHPQSARTLSGIAYAMTGFSIFSLQDAIVKWLVTSLPVWEILFVRSLVIMVIALMIAGPRSVPSIFTGPSRNALLIRSALILAAWISYFTAAKSLHLAELVTIYFSTPIFVILMSVFALKETVGAARWATTLIGFIGVMIAANPSGTTEILPIFLTLIAAFCWAWTNILVRMISRTETTMTLMIASNGLFIVACGIMLPFVWVTPDLFSIGLMIALGGVGGLGQYFLFEGYRLAPASAVAPFEYVTLVWAFAWGYLIWHDWPAEHVFFGAGLILLSGLGLLYVENRTFRRTLKS